MFLVLEVKVPLIWYLETTRKILKTSHLLLHFSIEQLFSFIILGGKNGDMSSFKFFFPFMVFSGKIRIISWFLCNTGKYFLKIVLILGSIGLYFAMKLHVVEKLLLILGLLASSLDIFLTSEKNFF